jgi:hypothetical protein
LRSGEAAPEGDEADRPQWPVDSNFIALRRCTLYSPDHFLSLAGGQYAGNPVLRVSIDQFTLPVTLRDRNFSAINYLRRAG